MFKHIILKELHNLFIVEDDDGSDQDINQISSEIMIYILDIVVLNDYRGPRPYNNFNNHRVTYYKGYLGSGQSHVGYKNNARYYNDDSQSDNLRQYAHRREYDDHRESKKHQYA